LKHNLGGMGEQVHNGAPNVGETLPFGIMEAFLPETKI